MPLTYSINYGEKITLMCKITCSPAHTIVYWQKNQHGKISNITSGYPGITGCTFSNPSLTIEHTTASDTGLYRCIAVNVIGAGISKDNINITVIACKFTNYICYMNSTSMHQGF